MNQDDFNKKYKRSGDFLKFMLEILDELPETPAQHAFFLKTGRVQTEKSDYSLLDAYEEVYTDVVNNMNKGSTVIEGNYDELTLVSKNNLSIGWLEFYKYLPKQYHTIFKGTDMTLGKIVKAFQKTGTVRATGDLLGISHPTVSIHLKRAGIKILPPGGSFKKGKKFINTESGQLAKWIREHPDVKLPLKRTEIAELTGCSLNVVECHLYRVRKKLKRKLSSLVSLKKCNIIFEEGKHVFNSKNFINFEYEVSLDFKVIIHANIAGYGEYTFSPINVDSLVNIIRNANK